MKIRWAIWLLLVSCGKEMPRPHAKPINAEAIVIECRMESAETGTFGTPEFYIGKRHLTVAHVIDTCIMNMTFGEFESDSFNIFIPGIVNGIPLHLDLYTGEIKRKYFDYYTDTVMDLSLNVKKDFIDY